jgi:UDP-glucose 4-epimerase
MLNSQAMSVIGFTGAGGYLAGRVIRLLEDHPLCSRIVGIDLKPPVAPSRKLYFYRRDVRDPELGRLFQQERVSIILHFAFVLNPIHNRNEMHAVNLAGTRNVLEAALQCSAGQILATSSTTAYGARPDNPPRLREEMPLRASARFQYATDKREMDLLLQDFARRHPQVAVCIFRPCIVLGPNVDNFISKGMTQAINIVIDGQNPEMQFVHEDDVARAVVLALERRARGIFNLAGEGAITLEEAWQLKGRGLRLNFPAWLAYWMIDLAWLLRLKFLEAPSSAMDFFRWPWVADGSKADRELGFTPQYSSRQIWMDYLRWLEEHPKPGLAARLFRRPPPAPPAPAPIKSGP